ncbi:MAG: type II toxin-antitoxin system RelE/ParE family toxin [Brevinematales bacterium]|jgi:proteic killer suppression protein
MIKSFRHKGLKDLFFFGNKKGVEAKYAKRLEVLLDFLENATSPKDMGFSPINDLHELKGDRKGTWAVTVKENWRITFRFEGDDAADIDLEDYH